MKSIIKTQPPSTHTILSAAMAACALFIQGCCCNCPTETSKVAYKSVCGKLARFSGKPDTEIQACLDDMNLSDGIYVAFHECIEVCDQRASGSQDVLAECALNCQNSLDAQKVPIKADVKVRGSSATISLNTFSNVSVKIESELDAIDGKKTKSNKKGAARLKLKKLPPGKHTATLKTSLKPRIGIRDISFEVKAPPFLIHSSADKVVTSKTLKCTINVRDDDFESFKVKNLRGKVTDDIKLLFDSAERTKLSVKYAGLRSITYRGKSRKAKKGKASFRLKRSELVSELDARSIFLPINGFLDFELKHATLGELLVKLQCPIEAAKTFRSGRAMLFDGESASDPRGGAAVVVDKDGDVVRVIGPADAKAKDVDLFIEINRSYKGTGTCRYKTSEGYAVDVERNTVRDTVKITDRRTGRTVANKTFSGGRASCPRTLSAGREYVFGSDPSESKIDAFITRTLKKRR